MPEGAVGVALQPTEVALGDLQRITVRVLHAGEAHVGVRQEAEHLRGAAHDVTEAREDGFDLSAAGVVGQPADRMEVVLVPLEGGHRLDEPREGRI